MTDSDPEAVGGSDATDTTRASAGGSVPDAPRAAGEYASRDTQATRGLRSKDEVTRVLTQSLEAAAGVEALDDLTRAGEIRDEETDEPKLGADDADDERDNEAAEGDAVVIAAANWSDVIRTREGLEAAFDEALERHLEITGSHLRDLLRDKITVALLRVLVVYLAGVFGYFLIATAFHLSGTPVSLLDAFYFAAISLTTVGYGDSVLFESLSTDGQAVAKAFTILYVLISYVFVVWASSTVVAHLVEGTLTDLLQRRKMLRKLKHLTGHDILAGIGLTGQYIVDEYRITKNPLVVIDIDADRREPVNIDKAGENDIFFLEGDATDEDVLLAAGIHRARSLIANLSNDRDSLFLVLTARAMNPKLRIVVRSIDLTSQRKLLRAGANAVVAPNYIGGMRLAAETLRPKVTTFLDRMTRDRDRVIRLEEVTIEKHSRYCGKTLATSRIHQDTGLWAVAILRPGKDEWAYNPAPTTTLEPGTVLVVIGGQDQVKKLKAMAAPAAH